jgi:hypothetical protein
VATGEALNEDNMQSLQQGAPTRKPAIVLEAERALRANDVELAAALFAIAGQLEADRSTLATSRELEQLEQMQGAA